jgi:hypothetical protein
MSWINLESEENTVFLHVGQGKNLLSGQTPVIHAPTLAAAHCLHSTLFYGDGAPCLEDDLSAACSALRRLCCPSFWLFCLALPMLSAGLPSFRMAYFASVYV